MNEFLQGSVARKALVMIAWVAALGSQPMAAWTQKTQLAIGESARQIAPPALSRQLERHAATYREGLMDPFTNSRSQQREKNPDGSGKLDEVIREETQQAIEAIRAHEPFAQVAFRLGRLAHFIALANNPLQTTNSDDREPRTGPDFVRYVESAQPRFRLVVYGRLNVFSTVDALLLETFSRSRRDYDLISREYRRVGEINGRKLFDDRSTAFAVAAVSFNRGISDIARVLRYIWIESGGVDPRGAGQALRPPRSPS